MLKNQNQTRSEKDQKTLSLELAPDKKLWTKFWVPHTGYSKRNEKNCLTNKHIVMKMMRKLGIKSDDATSTFDV